MYLPYLNIYLLSFQAAKLQKIIHISLIFNEISAIMWFATVGDDVIKISDGAVIICQKAIIYTENN